MTAPEDGALPSVSFVVAARDERRHIAGCVTSLLEQDYPRDRLEVVVVDGGSGDGTPDIVRTLARGDGRVRLRDNPRRVAASGFNIGIAESSGEIVSLAGAHSRLDADYTRRLVRAFESSGAALVGGQARAEPGRPTAEAAAVARAISSPFGVGNARFRYGGAEGWVNTAYPGAYRRWLFARIGAFDESLVRNQDDDLHHRARSAGYAMWFDPALVSTYYARPSLGALFRQYTGDGRWRAATLAKHGRVSAVRQLAPPALVAALAVVAPGSPVPARGALRVAVLAPYLAFLAAGTVREARRGAWGTELALVPLSLAAVHLGYGWGFWAGVVRRRGGSPA
ncbi:MAG TPA: glycosyltransferase family 2 protein [Mycobacteriales bacterium]|nr:glycosyltransferase family 2 protein [Mycobacteriales bacterium]